MGERKSLAFSLLELAIVLVVVAVIAAIAVVRLSTLRQNTAMQSAHASLRVYARAALQYLDEWKGLPADRSPGVFPPEFTGYFASKPFTQPTPVGGNWDWNGTTASPWNSVGASMSIHINPKPAKLWETMDARFDDGVLTTGILRLYNSNRNFCFMLEP